MRRQIFLTPAAGKRLIARAIMSRPDVRDAMFNHSLLIVGGTTNGYIAEEALNIIGQSGIDRKTFFRGIVKPADVAAAANSVQDVLIRNGEYIPDATIYDAADKLQHGDIIMKGANAVHLAQRQAGVLIGHPQLGTLAYAVAAAAGRKVKCYAPVGVEKRVELPIHELALMANDTDGGLGLGLSPGIPYTEIDALKDMFNVKAEILASGGVCGYEGACYFICTGAKEDILRLVEYEKELMQTENFTL